MTSKELRVSLKLQAGTQTGQVFEDVLVSDTACTLAEFLDGALKDLEVSFGGIGVAWLEVYTC